MSFSGQSQTSLGRSHYVVCKDVDGVEIFVALPRIGGRCPEEDGELPNRQHGKYDLIHKSRSHVTSSCILVRCCVDGVYTNPSSLADIIAESVDRTRFMSC